MHRDSRVQQLQLDRLCGGVGRKGQAGEEKHDGSGRKRGGERQKTTVCGANAG